MEFDCSLPPGDALLVVGAIRKAMIDGLSEEKIRALPLLQLLPVDERKRVIEQVKTHPDTLAFLRRHGRIRKLRWWFPVIPDEKTGSISNLGCFFAALIVIPGIPLGGAFVAYLLHPWIERMALNQAFGPGAYENGLRLMRGRHFRLTNGGTLSGWPAAMYSILSLFSLAVPMCLYFLTLKWIYGERDEDEKVKQS